jgi:hypothetical protein
MLELFLLIAVGRVLIHLWGKFPLPEWFDNSKFGKLHHCTECAGVWIYSILFMLFGVDILNMVGLQHVFIGGFIGGAIISFVMNLLEIGFRERFMTITIE